MCKEPRGHRQTRAKVLYYKQDHAEWDEGIISRYCNPKLVLSTFYTATLIKVEQTDECSDELVQKTFIARSWGVGVGSNYCQFPLFLLPLQTKDISIR